MLNLRQFCAVFSLVALTAAPTLAKSCHDADGAMHHAGMSCKERKKGNCAMRGYIRANHVMHRGMDIQYTGNADVDFVAGMIPHHQGAVDMAQVVLTHGKDPEIRKLAENIVTWQEAEIGFMKQWLSARTSPWRAENAKELDSVKAYVAAMHDMHRGMDIRYTGDADYDFVKGMIPHHQGAIDMAWVLKKHGSSQDLRKLADDIIRSQGQEIRLMEAWLDAHPAPKKRKQKARENSVHAPSSH